MYNWKIGDKVYDLETLEYGIGTVVSLDSNYSSDVMQVLFKNHKEALQRYKDDRFLVPVEIYESPLYQALKEEEQ